ncbi:hypothetical protein GGR56DRAFT_574283 [Xylariaceae sp. FL0804]|nr:hypothetical protein GGR56DRAFT_574283 [Xylariaceae sp. FL0804]
METSPGPQGPLAEPLLGRCDRTGQTGSGAGAQLSRAGCRTGSCRRGWDQWKMETLGDNLRRHDPGEARLISLIDEMRVIWSNGWKHLQDVATGRC